MWEDQLVRKPLRRKLKKLLTVVYYILMTLLLVLCLCVICFLEILKHR